MTDKTDKQRRSFHLWLDKCAETLNDAGIDQRLVMASLEVEAPNTGHSLKESVYKPLQQAIHGFESTEDNSTTSYDLIVETIHRHFAEKHNVTLPPWPSLYEQSQEFAGRLYGKDKT